MISRAKSWRLPLENERTNYLEPEYILWWWADSGEKARAAEPGLTSFCRTGELQPESAGAGCSELQQQPGSPDNCSQGAACSVLQPRAAVARYQWGHHQSINCVSGARGGEGKGGGPNTRTSFWLSPGLWPGTGYWQKFLEVTKYHKLSYNNNGKCRFNNPDEWF